MAEPLLDAEWFRVAELRPRLRSHVRILRHFYRGQLWYVIQDASTGRFHRFTPAAYHVIGLMDGERSLQGIWDTAAGQLGDDVPTQRETIRLLHQLHSADVLQADIRPDVDELLRRHDKHRRQKWLQQLRSPLAIRVPLVDPERVLRVLEPLGRVLFSATSAVIWTAVVVAGLVQAMLDLPELTRDVSARVLTAQNIVLLLVVFPVVKLLHELGHAFAVKRWGGEVHQLGVMFIVFMPIPFVDATAATAFRNKYQRVLVGAAGMLVELFLAALALLVWSNAEPGLVKAAAYNVVFIASVSTLIFNGNPLLRFDAYYILADWVEIPNLAQRSNRYLFHLVQRHMLRMQVDSPVSARGERGWFVGYAVASFCYRVVVYFGIALFVGSEFYFVGVLLAIIVTFSLFVMPVLKGIKFLFSNAELRGRRAQALGIASLPPVAIALSLLATPAPLFTVAEGVQWTPETSLVRAGTDGFVAEVVAASGAEVQPGEVLMRLQAPIKQAEVRMIEAEVAALEAMLRNYRESDWVQVQITEERIRGAQARLQRGRAELEDLLVRAPVAGRFLVSGAEDLPGRFAPKGQLLGYVLEPGAETLKVVVTEAEVDLVRQRTRAVEVRRTERLGERLQARVVRELPSASFELPGVALGSEGGGRIAIDPGEKTRRRAFEKVFLFDLQLPPGEAPHTLGGRVYVRFDHGYEPLYARWYRSLRRVFLSHFDA